MWPFSTIMDSLGVERCVKGWLHTSCLRVLAICMSCMSMPMLTSFPWPDNMSPLVHVVLPPWFHTRHLPQVSPTVSTFCICFLFCSVACLFLVGGGGVFGIWFFFFRTFCVFFKQDEWGMVGWPLHHRHHHCHCHTATAATTTTTTSSIIYIYTMKLMVMVGVYDKWTLVQLDFQ